VARVLPVAGDVNLGKVALCSLAGILVGVVAGLILGHALWGQDVARVADLNGELEKTKSWLLDEISWSDERYDQVSAALTKAQTDLAQARAELARTRGTVEQTPGNVKPDRLQAHEPNEAARPTSTR
jgi:multidrug resistance efflux pump